jgi:outer membrane protein TolC
MRALGVFASAVLVAPLALLALPASAQDGGAPLPTPELPRVEIQPTPVPSISLSRAIELALSRNPTAILAYEEIRRAEALAEQTRSASLPTIAGSGVFTQLDSARRAANVVTQPQTGLLLAATADVPLVVPRSWALWSQSRDQVNVASLSASDTRRLLAVAVARAYLAVVAQKREIVAVTRARDTDRAHYEYAQTRYQGGLGNRIDAVRAVQQWQSDEANLEAQYSSLARQREALGVFAGVDGPLDAEEPNLQAATDPKRAMSDAERRSDVVLENARLEAARHMVRDDWTDYSPYVTGEFMPFYSTPATPTYPTTGWQAQLVLTVPLFGGLRYGVEKEHRVNRDEEISRLDGVLRQARSEVRTAFEELRRADGALRDATKAAELAETALDLANTAYKSGAATNIEVIDAERTALDAETAVAVAEDNARQARLDLLSATGRFP